MKDFPDTLYVAPPIDDDVVHYGYSRVDDIEADVVVGVYELVKIQKVKVTETRSLEDIEWKTLPPGGYVVPD